LSASIADIGAQVAKASDIVEEATRRTDSAVANTEALVTTVKDIALCTTSITCPTDTVLSLTSASVFVVCAASALTSEATTAKPRQPDKSAGARIDALKAACVRGSFTAIQ
jgi:hypothetical protein